MNYTTVASAGAYPEKHKNMARSAWIIAACFLLLSPLWAQPSGQYEQPDKSFNAWGELKNDLGLYNNKLYGFNDHYLALSDYRAVDLQLFHYKNIEQIKIRRKGRVGLGMLIGAAVGTGIGFLLGEAFVDEPGEPYYFGYIAESLSSPLQKDIYILGGFSVGLITGGIIGAQTRKYPVNGQQAYFEAFKTDLKKR